MIKLISVDLDGTLLNEQGAVDLDIRDSVAAIQDQGVRIVVNTGRDYRSAGRIAREAGIRGGIICCNGSCVYDGEGNKLFDHPLSAEVVQKAERILAEEDFPLSYFTQRGQYMLMNLREYQICLEKKLLPLVLDHKNSLQDVVTETENWWEELRFCKREELEQEEIYKLNAVWYPQKEAAARAAERLQALEGVTVACTNMGDMEVTMPGIDKGSGLLEYAKAWGIELDKILVMGDSENDLPAMELPGVHPVAMGNAKEFIRRSCKYVTAGNGEGGVKRVLDKILCMLSSM